MLDILGIPEDAMFALLAAVLVPVGGFVTYKVLGPRCFADIRSHLWVYVVLGLIIGAVVGVAAYGVNRELAPLTDRQFMGVNFALLIFAFLVGAVLTSKVANDPPPKSVHDDTDASEHRPGVKGMF